MIVQFQFNLKRYTYIAYTDKRIKILLKVLTSSISRKWGAGGFQSPSSLFGLFCIYFTGDIYYVCIRKKKMTHIQKKTCSNRKAANLGFHVNMVHLNSPMSSVFQYMCLFSPEFQEGFY